MIRWIRTAVPSDNKAYQWAKEITVYVSKIYPDVQIKVFTPRFGKTNMIMWTADAADLVALDAYQNKIGEDEGYQKMLAEGSEYFVYGTIFDKVLETL